MTDFNQLHKLANELEEFSATTIKKNIKLRPKPINSGTLLLSDLESNASIFSTKELNINSNMLNTEKKTWPTSPSLEFFSSPEVIQEEQKELKQAKLNKTNQIKQSDIKFSKNNLNAQTLLSSMNNFFPIKKEKKIIINNTNTKDTNLKNNHELNSTLKNIGFVTVEDSFNKQKQNKQNHVFVEANLIKNTDSNTVIKSQAFTCLNKELGFSLFSFILDSVLNFSIFVLINSIYKIFFIESLFNLSTLSFFFIFSLIFQISSFSQRVFFKKTFGEWYSNVQLGTEKQQSDPFFFISLFWKSFITLCTGVVVLPTLSFLINKDLSYYLTDLQIFEKINK
ncbi:MAG: hypothetical protein HAW60_04560 [Bdellovibrionales bacterium]|nr:hypothetical protein [Bdellovibrionales bacterium]